MSCSCRSISSGSSDSASICSRVSALPNVRLPIGRPLLGVAADGDRILEVLQRQDDHVLVLTRADADVVQNPRLEPRELGLDGVAARLQSGDRRDTLVGGWRWRDRRGLRRVLEPGHGDGRGRNHRAGLIDDGEDEGAVTGCLCGDRTSRDDQPRKHRKHENTKPSTGFVVS